MPRTNDPLARVGVRVGSVDLLHPLTHVRRTSPFHRDRSDRSATVAGQATSTPLATMMSTPTAAEWRHHCRHDGHNWHSRLCAGRHVRCMTGHEITRSRPHGATHVEAARPEPGVRQRWTYPPRGPGSRHAARQGQGCGRRPWRQHARKIRNSLPGHVEWKLCCLADDIAGSLRKSADVLQRTSHQIPNSRYP
jgi:hypothetical protein